MTRKSWTTEEEILLQDRWGVVSIKAIANQVGRSIEAVKMKAAKLGLTDPRMLFDGITICQLALALDKSYNSVRTWIDRYQMPAKKKIFCKSARVLVIGYQEFWQWAEQNKELLNFAKMDANVLGPEPEWVKVKRKADKMRSQKTWQSVNWTAQDDQLLKQLVISNGVTYPYLAERFNRSEASVKRRLYDLGVKLRPERLNNHVRYTAEDTERLMLMARQGYSYESIAAALGKSALGVRGKLERMQFDFKRREFRKDEVRA